MVVELRALVHDPEKTWGQLKWDASHARCTVVLIHSMFMIYASGLMSSLNSNAKSKWGSQFPTFVLALHLPVQNFFKLSCFKSGCSHMSAFLSNLLETYVVLWGVTRSSYIKDPDCLAIFSQQISKSRLSATNHFLITSPDRLSLVHLAVLVSQPEAK